MLTAVTAASLKHACVARKRLQLN